MGSFTYEDIETLYNDNNKVFKTITAYLKDEHGLAFQGARKTGERQLDRYVRAFNKHYNDIQKVFAKTIKPLLSSKAEQTPKKTKGKGKVNARA